METASAEDPHDAISESVTSETLSLTPELYSGAVSRDLFAESSEGSHKQPSPSPVKSGNPGAKNAAASVESSDTNQPKPQRESWAIKFLQKALKQTDPEQSKLMKTIPAPQY